MGRKSKKEIITDTGEFKDLLQNTEIQESPEDELISEETVKSLFEDVYASPSEVDQPAATELKKKRGRKKITGNTQPSTEGSENQSLISGKMLIGAVNVGIPAIFKLITGMSPDIIKLTDEQTTELEPVATPAAAQLSEKFSKLDPLTFFSFSLLFVYVINFSERYKKTDNIKKEGKKFKLF